MDKDQLYIQFKDYMLHLTVFNCFDFCMYPLNSSYHSRSEVSGSECESVLRHSGHRHRQPNHQSNGNTSHRGSALELVDSQPQWLESQKRRQQHHQALNSSISYVPQYHNLNPQNTWIGSDSPAQVIFLCGFRGN